MINVTTVNIVPKSDLNAMPEWFGWFMIALAVVVSFPSLIILTESNNSIIWQTKVAQMGIVYGIGTLFWAFISWVISAGLLAVGIEAIRKHDKKCD